MDTGMDTRATRDQTTLRLVKDLLYFYPKHVALPALVIFSE